jgi:hypothetical protein
VDSKMSLRQIPTSVGYLYLRMSQSAQQKYTCRRKSSGRAGSP